MTRIGTQAHSYVPSAHWMFWKTHRVTRKGHYMLTQLQQKQYPLTICIILTQKLLFPVKYFEMYVNFIIK